MVIGAGNPGAVAISWNVAQQTALRDVEVTAANDTAVALDLGAGADYEKLKGSGGSLSAGGVVEDIVLRVALTGLRGRGHPGLAAQRRCSGQHAAGRAGSPRRLVTGRA